MTCEELLASLRELHEELWSVDASDDETCCLLTQITSVIDQLLGGPVHSPSFFGRLQEMDFQFEARHPKSAV